MSAAAFVVGINEYPEYAKLKPLAGAVADAVDFADWALDPDGGNIAAEDLRFWAWPPPKDPPPFLAEYLKDPTPWFRGDPGKGPPDYAHISQSICEVIKAGGLDRIYIFFAGHGIIVDLRNNNERPQSCFMAGDYVAGYSDGLIPCDDLQLALERIGPAEVVLVFDCCRSELSPTQNRPALNWPNYDRGEIDQHIVTARGAQPRSLAFEIDETTNPRGAFSRLLTFGLRYLRSDDALTTAQLEEYVYANIGRLVKPRMQVPDIVVIPNRSHFTLVSGPPMKPDLPLHVSFQPAHAGKTVELRNHKLTKIAEIPANGAPWHGAFPIGKYSLEIPAERLSIAIEHYGPEPTHVTF